MPDIPVAARCFSCAHRRYNREVYADAVPYCAVDFQTLRFVDEYGEPLSHSECSRYENEQEARQWKPRSA